MDPMYLPWTRQFWTSKPFGLIRFSIFHLPMSHWINRLCVSIQATQQYNIVLGGGSWRALRIWPRPRGQRLHTSSQVRNGAFIFLNEWIYLNCLLVLGVSLTWLGFVPSNFSLTPSSAIYYIDGQPVSFFVPALSTAGALPLYNQVLFQTGQLSAGQHKLIVTHQGNSGTAPLALDYFVVQNAMSPSATSALASATSTISSSVPSGSSSDSTSNLGSKKSPPVGIIVGVVCGVTVVLLLLLLLYIRRRKHRRALELSENSYSASDSSDAVHPFTSSQPQSYTSESQSLIPQTLANKFSQRGEPTDTPSTFNNMRPTSPPTDGGRMPVLTPSQIHSSSPLVPTTSPLSYLSGAKTNSVSHATQHTEIMPLVQLSAFAQSSDPNFLQHEDSGIRMPPLAQDSRVEVPPVYTTRWCRFFL